jgi:hypothetical protein
MGQADTRYLKVSAFSDEVKQVIPVLELQANPDLAIGVRVNRAFLGRAVRFLAGEAGIRQFLDIGTGIPSANNTHEVAQEVAPESRIVYVDDDPMVLAHAGSCWHSR